MIFPILILTTQDSLENLEERIKTLKL